MSCTAHTLSTSAVRSVLLCVLRVSVLFFFNTEDTEFMEFHRGLGMKKL